jgi:hypothetical protein
MKFSHSHPVSLPKGKYFCILQKKTVLKQLVRSIIENNYLQNGRRIFCNLVKMQLQIAAVCHTFARVVCA